MTYVTVCYDVCLTRQCFLILSLSTAARSSELHYLFHSNTASGRFWFGSRRQATNGSAAYWYMRRELSVQKTSVYRSLCWPNSESQDQRLTEDGGEGFFEHQVRRVKSAPPPSLFLAFGDRESIQSADRYREIPFIGTNPTEGPITSGLPVIECLLEAADCSHYQMRRSGGGAVTAPVRF